MKVKIEGKITDGYQIVPVTEDEELFVSMEDLCGFHEYEDAEVYAIASGWEIES